MQKLHPQFDLYCDMFGVDGNCSWKTIPGSFSLWSFALDSWFSAAPGHVKECEFEQPIPLFPFIIRYSCGFPLLRLSFVTRICGFGRGMGLNEVLKNNPACICCPRFPLFSVHACWNVMFSSAFSTCILRKAKVFLVLCARTQNFKCSQRLHACWKHPAIYRKPMD